MIKASLHLFIGLVLFYNTQAFSLSTQEALSNLRQQNIELSDMLQKMETVLDNEVQSKSNLDSILGSIKSDLSESSKNLADITKILPDISTKFSGFATEKQNLMQQLKKLTKANSEEQSSKQKMLLEASEADKTNLLNLLQQSHDETEDYRNKFLEQSQTVSAQDEAFKKLEKFCNQELQDNVEELNKSLEMIQSLSTEITPLKSIFLKTKQQLSSNSLTLENQKLSKENLNLKKKLSSLQNEYAQTKERAESLPWQKWIETINLILKDINSIKQKDIILLNNQTIKLQTTLTDLRTALETADQKNQLNDQKIAALKDDYLQNQAKLNALQVFSETLQEKMSSPIRTTSSSNELDKEDIQRMLEEQETKRRLSQIEEDAKKKEIDDLKEMLRRQKEDHENQIEELRNQRLQDQTESMKQEILEDKQDELEKERLEDKIEQTEQENLEQDIAASQTRSPATPAISQTYSSSQDTQVWDNLMQRLTMIRQNIENMKAQKNLLEEKQRKLDAALQSFNDQGQIFTPSQTQNDSLNSAQQVSQPTKSPSKLKSITSSIMKVSNPKPKSSESPYSTPTIGGGNFY